MILDSDSCTSTLPRQPGSAMVPSVPSSRSVNVSLDEEEEVVRLGCRMGGDLVDRTAIWWTSAAAGPSQSQFSNICTFRPHHSDTSLYKKHSVGVVAPIRLPSNNEHGLGRPQSCPRPKSSITSRTRASSPGQTSSPTPFLLSFGANR